MLTTINDLFVFVPIGIEQTFIKRYASDDAYKHKISFIEETGEIYTNGKCFGANYKSAINELTTKVQEVQDKNTEISKLLKDFDSGKINAINEWITNHGTEFTILSD